MKSLVWAEQILDKHRTMLFFTSANLGLQIASFCAQFVSLRFVPPGDMGIWQFVTMVEVYLMFSRLGVVNAMNREYPFLCGRGDFEQAKAIVRTAQTYSILNGAVASAIFFVIGIFRYQWGPAWRIALFAMALSVPAQLYLSYLEGTYRAENEFHRLSILRLVQIPLLGITLVLPWRLGLAGFCLRSLLLALVSTILAHRYRPVRLPPGFSMPQFKTLIATGWHLLIWNYSFQLVQSFPRLAVVTLGGITALGLFTPVNWCMVALGGLSGSISAYLSPVLTFRYAKARVSVGIIALKAAMLIVLIMIPAVVCGFFLLPAAVLKLTPGYALAIPAARLALIVSLVDCFSIATIKFAATKAWRAMYVYLFFNIVLRFVGCFAGYHIGSGGMLGVTAGMLMSSIAMLLVTWLTVRGETLREIEAETIESSDE